MTEIERKVTKFSNSLGIRMMQALKQIGLEQRHLANISVDPTSRQIKFKKSTKVLLLEAISADFMDTLNNVLTEYDQTLFSLKNR
ncbi:AbrB family transcriptional regulator [Saccharibacillus sacchari]|uniref:AbrB family transcriptional regulator n=1 Tax=Saccharibacillus sacchari TaxID=456493 RepID=A0ACC6PGN0_9BACL